MYNTEREGLMERLAVVPVQALSVHPSLLSSVDFHTKYGRRVVLATKEVTMGTKVSKPPATLGATWEL